MKVMPYDPSHEEVYNANVYHENLNRTENRGFFLHNLPKPTDRKHFETVTTLPVILVGSDLAPSHLSSTAGFLVLFTAYTEHCLAVSSMSMS